MKKMDPEGNLIWYRVFAEETSVYGVHLELTHSGDVCFSGEFAGSIDLDPGPEQDIVLAGGPSAKSFLVKLNSNGEYIWGRGFSGEDTIEINDFAVGAEDELTLVGRFTGEVDFDPGADVMEIETVGSSDMFVLRLNAQGDFEWVLNYGNENIDALGEIELSAQGEMYLQGIHYGSLDIDPGPGESWVESNGSADILIQKLDSEGNFIWGGSIGSSGLDNVGDIAVDGENNLLIVGDYGDEVDFDMGSGVQAFTSEGAADAFVLKLDSMGNYLWCKSFGGELGDDGAEITVDSLDYVYAAIKFNGEVGFDGNNSEYVFDTNGDWESALVRWNPDGQFEWAGWITGSGNTSHLGLEIDPEGYLITAGSFVEQVDLDFYGVSYINNPEEWVRDPFIAKYDKSCMLTNEVESMEDHLVAVQTGAEYQW
ncbi:MAG: hypothetical protein AAF193_09445, partial [Bacteroidota bacterium]